MQVFFEEQMSIFTYWDLIKKNKVAHNLYSSEQGQQRHALVFVIYTDGNKYP